MATNHNCISWPFLIMYLTFTNGATIADDQLTVVDDLTQP